MSMNEGDVKYFSFDGNDLIVDKENDDVTYNDEKHVYVGKRSRRRKKIYFCNYFNWRVRE